MRRAPPFVESLFSRPGTRWSRDGVAQLKRRHRESGHGEPWEAGPSGCWDPILATRGRGSAFVLSPPSPSRVEFAGLLVTLLG